MTKTPFLTRSTIGSINSDHSNLPNFSCATDMHFISPGIPIDFGPYDDSSGFSSRDFKIIFFEKNILEWNFVIFEISLGTCHGKRILVQFLGNL